VVSARHFDTWWKRASRGQPDLLTLQVSDVVADDAGADVDEEFPRRWTSGEFDLALSYRFEPGSAADGVAVDIPLAQLTSLDTAALDRPVPGQLEELVIALLRGLPKDLRRPIVPVPDTATELVAAVRAVPGDRRPLTEILSEELLRRRGLHVPPDAWSPDTVPVYLRPTYRVIADDGTVVAEGKDLTELRRRLAPQVRSVIREATADLTRAELRDWDFDELPRQVERVIGGHRVIGFPALVERTSTGAEPTVGIDVLDSAEARDAAMWAGTRRLLIRTVPSPLRQIRRELDPASRLMLSRSPHGSLDALLADCLVAAVDLAMRDHGAPVWTRADFERLRAAVAADLPGLTDRTLRTVARILDETQRTELDLAAERPPFMEPIVADERAHLASLVYPGFVSRTDPAQLAHLPRYLQAIRVRLSDARTNAARDAQRRAMLEVVLGDVAEVRTGSPDAAPFDRLHWTLEEYRVSLFAQRLGTAQVVSVNRIHALLDAIEAGRPA
jgi:ATP-dependent helicase HrpA